MVVAKFNTPKFNDLIQGYLEVVDDIDAAAVECVEVAQEILYGEMLEGLLRHRDKGDAVEALIKPPVVMQGNVALGEVGTWADSRSDPRFPGFMHSQYQEYGSPTFAKDPWFRPALDNNKAFIRREQQRVMERRAGVKTK